MPLQAFITGARTGSQTPAYIGLGDSVCAMRLADRGKPTGRLSSALDHWRDRGRHARLTLGPLSRTRPARPWWEPVATRETSSHRTTACRQQARDGGCRECMETYAATVRNVVRVHNEDGAQSEVVGRGDTDLGGAGEASAKGEKRRQGSEDASIMVRPRTLFAGGDSPSSASRSRGRKSCCRP